VREAVTPRAAIRSASPGRTSRPVSAIWSRTVVASIRAKVGSGEAQSSI
jgi:hypothetical protein